MSTVVSVVAISLCMLSSAVHAQRVAPAAVQRVAPHATASFADVARSRAPSADERRGMPTWLKWGLVGAAAGAVTFPILGSMGGASNGEPAQNAVAGAAAGFVIVGGSVALWQAVCGPDSSSRRAGLCGR